jgi:hypothetical protein
MLRLAWCSAGWPCSLAPAAWHLQLGTCACTCGARARRLQAGQARAARPRP